MTAAEWRKRIRALNGSPEATMITAIGELFRDFEAAEADLRLNASMLARQTDLARDAEARAAQLLDAAHRLEDRCVAAEEERNAAEARAQAAEARVSYAATLVGFLVQAIAANDPWRELMYRAKELRAALSPQERGGQEV